MASNSLAIDAKRRQPVWMPLEINHLPQIESPEQAACNALYRCPSVSWNGLGWHWHLNAARRPVYQVRFAAGADQLRLNINGDIVGLDCEPLDWAHYKGQAQLVAWMCMHENFVQLIQAVWGCDWTLEGIENEAMLPVTNRENEITVGFSVHHKKGEMAVSGDAVFPMSWAEKIVLRSEDNAVDKPGVDQAWLAASARLPWIIDSFEVTQREWRSIVSGSVVRLDNTSLNKQPARVSVVIGKNVLIGNLDGFCIRIVASAHNSVTAQQTDTDPGGLVNMNSEYIESEGNNEAVETNVDRRRVALSTDGLPVTLAFEAGQLELPFAELSRIKPGYVFELDKKLEDRFITVYANGSRIGRGQLVVVDDFVGVRITELNTQ